VVSLPICHNGIGVGPISLPLPLQIPPQKNKRGEETNLVRYKKNREEHKIIERNQIEKNRGK
jgi:hypothetical protein